MNQNSEKFQNIYFSKMRRMGELESSAWSGALGWLSSRANVTSSDLEAVSLPANGTSDKSRGGLLEGQCDFKEVLGEARKRLGASSQRRGSHQQGALVSGVFVQLGHPGCRLEWGDVHDLADLCKEI